MLLPCWMTCHNRQPSKRIETRNWDHSQRDPIISPPFPLRGKPVFVLPRQGDHSSIPSNNLMLCCPRMTCCLGMELEPVRQRQRQPDSAARVGFRRLSGYSILHSSSGTEEHRGLRRGNQQRPFDLAEPRTFLQVRAARRESPGDDRANVADGRRGWHRVQPCQRRRRRSQRFYGKSERCVRIE